MYWLVSLLSYKDTYERKDLFGPTIQEDTSIMSGKAWRQEGGATVIFYVQPRSRMMIGKWDLAIKTSEYPKDPPLQQGSTFKRAHGLLK